MSLASIASLLAAAVLVVLSLWRRDSRQASGKTDTARFWVSVAVSAVFLGAGLYVILLGDYDDSTRKWAFGIVGLVGGFWLPAPSG